MSEETSGPPERPQRRIRFIDVIVIMAVFGVALSRALTTVADPDVWGHIRFGQDILRTGAIVQDDPYSYLTQDRPWINHEWLAEVVFAWLYDAAGPPGLIGFKSGVALLMAVYAYASLCRQGMNLVQAGVVLLIFVFAMMTGLGTIRPQLFTYLAFFVLLILIRRAEQGRIRSLGWAPPLFALWANLHGGFLAGMAVLGLWGLLSLAGGPTRNTTRGPGPVAWRVAVIAVLASSMLALFLNPYGGRLLSFLLRTATVPRPEILEWSPLRILSAEGAAYLALLALASAGFVFSRRRRGVAVVLVFYAIALMPLISMRHLPLFALAVVALGGEHLADAWSRRSDGDRSIAGLGLWLIVLNLVVIPVVFFLNPASFRCIRLEPGYFAYPARAVALLKQSGVSSNLAINFDWGEYAIWHLWPRIKVSVDGRRETVYSDETYREQLKFSFGLGDWDAFLKKTDTDMVLIDKNSACYNLMRLEPGWSLVYSDSLCALFTRQESPLRPPLANTQAPDIPVDGGGLCFP